MASKSVKFEEAMGRLDEIVEALERGNVSLEESIKLFEEGTKLSGQCVKLLDEAERKVVKLLRGPDGAPVEQELRHE